MSKPDWGIKRICPSCNMKYYDFDRSPIKCPSCSFEFDPDLLLKSRKGRGFSNKAEDAVSIEKVSKTAKDKKVEVEEDLEVIDNDTEILEIEEESSIDPGIVPDLEEEEGKNLDSELEDGLGDDIEVDEEELSFVDEDLDDQENEISVEVEDEEDKK